MMRSSVSHMCKRALICAVASLWLGVAAQAADYEKPPVQHSWAGPYIGLHAGIVFGEFTFNSALPGPGDEFASPIGGIQAGYLWQSGTLVFGLEADFSVMDIHARTSGLGAFEEELAMTFRGRLGWLVDPNSILFLSAGLALTNKETRFGGASATRLEEGVAVSAGYETWISEWLGWDGKWSGRIEAMYTEVEKDVQRVGGVPTAGGSDNFTARIALNYWF